MPEREKGVMVEVGAAWSHKDRRGAKFLSAQVNVHLPSVLEAIEQAEGRVLVFSNNWKNGKNPPDCRLMVAPPGWDGERKKKFIEDVREERKLHAQINAGDQGDDAPPQG